MTSAPRTRMYHLRHDLLTGGFSSGDCIFDFIISNSTLRNLLIRTQKFEYFTLLCS